MVFVAMLLAACMQDSKENTVVSSKQYGSSMCWINRDGDLSAFLVLAQEGRIAVPYPISAKCVVNGNYSSYGEGVLHHLNAVRIVDSYGTLQRALPTLKLSNSTISDQPVPYPHSKMYYFRVKIRNVPDKYMTIYEPIHILELIDLKLSFEAFLNLSVAERQSLPVGRRGQ